ncbi:MAG: hypothetical protein ACK56I_15920, partial [bacterium]
MSPSICWNGPSAGFKLPFPRQRPEVAGSPFATMGSAAVAVSVPEDVLPKTYDPVGTEARWQAAWEAAGAFHPDPAAPGDPFSVVIPPPNVTG